MRNKSTIFGEEHFIDTQMIKLVEQRNNTIDNYVFEQMENIIKGTLFVEMPKVEIDKEKLKKWVILCMKLENIEHSELIDMATKKKIADLEAKLTEKDKEIISLECVISEIHNDIKELHEFKVGEDEYDLTDSDARFSLQCDLLNNYQDKIDYAVEKLERVKEFFLEEHRDEEMDTDYLITKDAGEIADFLLNQIKQLKEGK